MISTGRFLTALLFIASIAGCASGPISFVGRDACVDATEPGSCEWWSERAQAPPGVRQRCHKGKMWPVRPRPTGEPQQFTHMYHSAHYWPLPYVCQDRDYVRNIIGIQEANGWQQQTTIYHRDFDENEMLTRPGELHLIDILEVTPDAFRVVYIQSSFNTDVDNIRVSNVQQTIADLTGGAGAVDVLVRQARGYSRPASEVKAINDLYDSSLPTPRLAGGGGGGGVSGATAAPGGP